MKCIVFLACLAFTSASPVYNRAFDVRTHEGSYYNPWQYLLSHYKNFQGVPWYPNSYTNYVQHPFYQSWLHSQTQSPELQKYGINQWFHNPEGINQYSEHQYPWTQSPTFQKYSNYPEGKYQYAEHPYVHQYPLEQHEQFIGQQFSWSLIHRPDEYLQEMVDYERYPWMEGYKQFHDSPIYWKNFWAYKPWTQQRFVGLNQEVPSWYKQWSTFWNPQHYEGKQSY